MSNDIKNWAKRQIVGDRNAKVVLLEIADVANDDGYSWYSIPTIAATLEASAKTVERGIAYLVSKEILTRTDRQKTGGKFTSKGTQINLPEDDWAEIRAVREKRKNAVSPTDKMTGGETQPTDNLTGGNDSPTDNLSEIALSPTDKMTDGQENQQTICPKPTDNLSNGQNDGQYIRDKELISEPSIETFKAEAEEAAAAAPATGHESEPDTPPDEGEKPKIFDEEEKLLNASPFVQTYQRYFIYTLSKTQKRLIVERVRDGTLWLEAVQYWAGDDYRPSSIGKLCNKYDELVHEKGEIENDGNAPSQPIPTRRSVKPDGGVPKQSNRDIIGNRDYKKYDGFDPLKAFGG